MNIHVDHVARQAQVGDYHVANISSQSRIHTCVKAVRASGLYVILAVFAVVTVVPFLWMVFSSFKTSGEIIGFPPTFVPRHPTLHNYRTLFRQVPFALHFFNSAFVATASTISVLFTGSAAGYIFAKYRFPGKTLLFNIILSTLMIPFVVIALPLFVQMANWDWINSYQALILPTAVSTFGIFLMRQYIKSIPDELLDAARIDGASEWWIYWRVILPLSRPALAALSIFHFSAVWDSFLWPLLVINDLHKWTLPLSIVSLNDEKGINYGLTLAGATVMVAPIFLVFLFAQKHFIRGVMTSGLKD